MRFVFLPGLDGTGFLFEPLLRLWTEKPPPLVIDYPSDASLGYKALQAYVLSKLPATEPYVLVAESFGGPIAARIAAQHPPALRGLVLSATFVRRPRGWLGNSTEFLVGPWMFRGTLFHHFWKIVLRLQGISPGHIKLILSALDHVPPEVLAARLKEALDVDAYQDLKQCEVPILCLYATRDLLLAKHCEETIGRATPRVKLVGFDAPHFLLQTKSMEALQEIRTFAQHLPA